MTLRLTRLFILIAHFVGYSTFVLASESNDLQQSEVSINHSYIKQTFRSRILNEDRELWIRLPNKYNESEKRYPVIYLLDGNRHLLHAMIAHDELTREGMMPESILVGIPNGKGTRSRDLSREKDKFTQFISDEVMTSILEQFRTTDVSVLFGHSMAGAFTLNTLVMAPTLFDAFIAASPVVQINNSRLLTLFEDSPRISKTIKPLFFSMGDEAAEGKDATQAVNQFVDLLARKQFQGLKWRYQHMPNQVHMTTPYLTLYQGLTHVFQDFQTPQFYSHKDYSNRGRFAGLKLHYIKRAKKYGVSEEIPGRALRQLAFTLIDDGQSIEAIKILEPHVHKNPESLSDLNALAEAYETVNVKTAIDIYQRSLKVAKTRKIVNAINFIESQIERLEKDQ